MLNFRSDVLPPMDSIIALYCAAPLYRPVDDLDRMRRMYERSNVILTTWDGDRLVALLRGITDGAYTTYVCDLAVHPDYQRPGLVENCWHGLSQRIRRLDWSDSPRRSEQLASGHGGHA